MTDRYYTVSEPSGELQSRPGVYSHNPTFIREHEPEPKAGPGEGCLDMIPNIQVTRASFDAGSERLTEIILHKES